MMSEEQDYTIAAMMLLTFQVGYCKGPLVGPLLWNAVKNNPVVL